MSCSIDGSDAPLVFPYPSDTLDYCGEKVENRRCPPDSLKDPKDHKIRINFGDI